MCLENSCHLCMTRHILARDPYTTASAVYAMALCLFVCLSIRLSFGRFAVKGNINHYCRDQPNARSRIMHSFTARQLYTVRRYTYFFQRGVVSQLHVKVHTTSEAF